MNSDPCKPAPCTLNPAAQCTVLPSYATAVSNPFHPVLKKCPDSVPVTQQSNSGPPQTDTATVNNPITTATVTMDTHGNNHYGNKEDATLLSNKQPPLTENSETKKTDFQTGQENGLSRVTETTVPLPDVEEEGYCGLGGCGGPGGWSSTGWREDGVGVLSTPRENGGVFTPRSDSSLSLRSSTSSSGRSE